jgi:ribosomal protein S18 acetylase RimI-like enzyme
VRDGADIVATSYGWVAGDAVAIYNVVTIPSARGRGLGALATLATMQLGVELGAQHAVLESTDAGYPLYRRLGFEEVGSFAVLVRRV